MHTAPIQQPAEDWAWKRKINEDIDQMKVCHNFVVDTWND